MCLTGKALGSGNNKVKVAVCLEWSEEKVRRRVVEGGGREVMVARPLGSLSGLGCIVIDAESQGHFIVLKEQ